MSAARPKIADYPFTTLVPNLGVVDAGGVRYTIADVPGLIPGASEGKGLGLEFLRHIERCAVIVHVLDCATLERGRDPESDLELIEAELAAYSEQIPPTHGHAPLMERPRLVVLNKADVPDAKELAEFVASDLRKKYPVHIVSAVSREGLRELSFALATMVEGVRNELPEEEPAPIVLRPEPRGSRQEFVVNNLGGSGGPVYQIIGEKPERWVRQTDFSNDEAVGYLADRLAKLGVEDELAKAGALAGDAVVIGPTEGGVVFDWEPMMATGSELLGPRGTDARFEQVDRPSRREKKEAFHERMDAKEEARQELWHERESGVWTDPEE